MSLRLPSRRLLSRLIALFLAFGPLLLPAFPLHAEEGAADDVPHIVIEEVAWAGSSISTSDEWLELANLGDATATIAGWSIRGAGAHDIFLPPNATIAPRGTYVISNNPETDDHSSLNVSVQLATTTISLSNSALVLQLANASGTIVDVAGNGDVPFAGSVNPKATMIRVMPADGSDPLSWESATSSVGLKNDVPDFAMPGVCKLCRTMMTTPSQTNATTTPSENEDGDEYQIGPEKPPENTADPGPNASDVASSTASGTEATEDPATATSTADIPVSTTSTEIILDGPIVATTTETALPEASPSTTGATPLAPLIFRLNEAVSNPADGPEWVELWTDNTMATATDRDMELHDAVGKIATVSSGTPLTAPGYLVVTLAHPHLNNGGDDLSLREPDGIVLDAIVIPAVNGGIAWAKTDAGTWAKTDLLTPGAPNRFSAPVAAPSATDASISKPVSGSTPANIVTTTTAAVATKTFAGDAAAAYPSGPLLHVSLNEAMPNPDAGKEWVELSIAEADATATDRNLELWDASGRIAKIPRETSIPAPGLLLITLSSARLNNGGDALSLREAGGEIVLDATDIPALKKGVAWARTDAGWTDAEPTPGAPNAGSDAVSATDDTGIANATTDAADGTATAASLIDPTFTFSTMPSAPNPNTRVRLVGTVGSVPRLLGATHAFILLGEDGRAAIVYLPKFLNTPSFGSTVRVMGTLTATERQLELRMKITDVWMTIATSTPPRPREVDFLAPGTEEAWALVAATGTVKSVATKSLVMDADGVDVTVSVPTVAGYRTKRLLPGDIVAVTGLLDPRKDDVTILARVPEDITLVEHAPETVVPPSADQGSASQGGMRDWLPFGAAAGAAGATGMFQRVRALLKRRKLTALAETSHHTGGM